MNGKASILIYGTAFLPKSNDFKYTELVITIDLSEARAFSYIPSFISICPKTKPNDMLIVHLESHRIAYR